MAKNRILLILFLALIFRLYHITFPVSGWHSWRQADTAAIAKNFYENGFNILYPQIDWAGNTPGYVESEFHVYPFIVSLLYALFGQADFWGRFTAVIFSVFTVYGLYLLTRKFIDESTALWAALIYAVTPLNIYFGRAFMPEPAMLCCSVYAVYFFSEWISRKDTKNFILAALFTSFAILIKLPALYLGLPLLFLAYNKWGIRFLLNRKLWLMAVIVIIPPAAWYYHAHQLLLNGGASFGIWEAGKDKYANWELVLSFKFYNDVFFKSIAERHLTYAGFIAFIYGLFIKRKTGEEKLFDWWLIAVIIYFIIAAKGNQVHEYYQLPFALPASVFAAKAFSKFISLTRIKESFKEARTAAVLSLAVFAVLCILSFLRLANFMKSEDYNSPLFRLEEYVKRELPAGKLVITISEGSPIHLYRTARKGWAAWPDALTEDYLSDKIKNGAEYIIGETPVFRTPEQRNRLENLMQKYEVVNYSPDIFVLKLKNNFKN
jgi:4-amino-4-deoxy-L-arabinose transferase-like glycosyltransferase